MAIFNSYFDITRGYPTRSHPQLSPGSLGKPPGISIVPSSLDSSLYFSLSITATVVFLVLSDWSEEVV